MLTNLPCQVILTNEFKVSNQKVKAVPYMENTSKKSTPYPTLYRNV